MMTKAEIDSIRHHRIFQYELVIVAGGEEKFRERRTPMMPCDRKQLHDYFIKGESLDIGGVHFNIERTMISGNHFKAPVTERGALQALWDYERRLDI